MNDTINALMGVCVLILVAAVTVAAIGGAVLMWREVTSTWRKR